MNKDISFLKELQEELRSQDDDYQASPRYWTIGDYEMVACPEGCEESYEVYLPNGDYNGDLDNFLDSLKDDELNDMTEEAQEEFAEIGCDVSAIEWIQKYQDEDAYLIPVREQHKVHPNTMFLTKAEAKQHLKSNHYHYSKKAHTYAMTAWRAPKVERLLKILENFNWDDITKDKEEETKC